MSQRSSVFVVTDCEDTGSVATSALSDDSRFAVDGVCRDMQDLASCMERTAAPAVLVDIDMQPTRMLAGLEMMTRRYAASRFIVLSNSLCNDMVLEAMQVGARHFMVKRDLASNLGPVLHRLVPNGTPKQEVPGSVVTVLSTSGGCGATTLAVNVAHELHLLASQAVLMVDLDSCYGGAATYLGVSSHYGLADILARNGDLDCELIRSTAQTYSDGLRLLVNPATINLASPAPLDYPRLHDALQVCRQTYHYTVLDAPRVPMDVAADLVRLSQATLMVLQLTVKDIGMARAMLSALLEHGAPTDLITLVASRYHKRRAMILPEDARKALDDLPLTWLNDDPKTALEGLNLGQPLAECAPRSPLRRELKQLTEKIHGAMPLQAATELAGDQ